MKIELPGRVSFIINNLKLHGYEAFAVGGCVRDAILAKEPEDWDITTSAPPKAVKRLFHHTIDTGIEHGTVTVLFGNQSYEVTTYRIDGIYENSRHPKKVTYTSKVEEDLKRRDFTINAMAYNEESRLVDVTGGMKDLNRHLVRCVGEPAERFKEDALRILRAIRFSAQLNFTVEENTAKAIMALASTLAKISAERIQTELVKILVSNHPEKIQDAYLLGITGQILPEWDAMAGVSQNNPHHHYDVLFHTINAMKAVSNDKILRLTMLFHDMGKPQTRTTDEKGIDSFYGHEKASAEIAKKVMERLKFDKDTIKKVTKLILFHNYRLISTSRSVRRGLHNIGVELFPYYLAIRVADIKAQSSHRRRQKLEEIVRIRDIYQKILREKQCFSLKDLAVSGQDLINLGMEPGEAIGEMLNELLHLVIDYPELNEKERLAIYVNRKLHGG